MYSNANPPAVDISEAVAALGIKNPPRVEALDLNEPYPLNSISAILYGPKRHGIRARYDGGRNLIQIDWDEIRYQQEHPDEFTPYGADALGGPDGRMSLAHELIHAQQLQDQFGGDWELLQKKEIAVQQRSGYEGSLIEADARKRSPAYEHMIKVGGSLNGHTN